LVGAEREGQTLRMEGAKASQLISLLGATRLNQASVSAQWKEVEGWLC